LSEEVVSKYIPGFMLVYETPKGETFREDMASLPDVAKWVIDSWNYYVSNDTMREVEAIVNSGGVAEVEFPVADYEGKSVTLLVIRNK
jgi:hypothetical protein